MREGIPQYEKDILLKAYVKQVQVDRCNPSQRISVNGVPLNKANEYTCNILLSGSSKLAL